MLEQDIPKLRQFILTKYAKALDKATRLLIEEEKNVFKLILFCGLCTYEQSIDLTFRKLKWIMHNISNGLAGAFMNLPQNMQSYSYLVELQSQLHTTTITEAHAVVFRSFPEHLKTVETLTQIAQINISLSHAWVFTNLQTSDPINELKALSQIPVSEHLDKIFCNFNPQEQTIDNLRFLSGKVLEHHVSIFDIFGPDSKTKIALENILNTSPPPNYYLAVFATFPLRERTPNTFKQLKELEFSRWQAVRFTTLPPQLPREKTFLEFKMMLPSPINAFNAVFQEAILTTVIRKDLVPILRKSSKYYNISVYDQIVYELAPIISKTIVAFTPAEVVTTFSSYVLRAGFPDSYEEANKAGLLFVVSGFLYAIPKFHSAMKVLSIINSLFLANSMAHEAQSIDNILIDIKNHATDSISLGSLLGSVAYYGFGLTVTSSWLVGVGASIAFIAVNDILESYYLYQHNNSPQDLTSLIGDIVIDLTNTSNISY